jgi:xanthine dehydrogenase YagR molybdenum-binding subunit
MSVINEAAQALVKKAVEILPDSWIPGKPDPLADSKHGLIGAPISRIDGSLKVRGAAPFAAEVPMEGMLYASLAYSTVPKGRIKNLDTTAAEAAPGVVLVMTYKNAPRMKPAPLFMTAAKAAGGDNLPVMQDNQIYWNGQPIAVVVAQTQEEADYASSLIQATFETEPAVTIFAEAKLHPHPQSFAGEPMLLKIGDAEAALAKAPSKVDITYRTPRQNHNAIELHAVTLAWNGDELIVHDASQCVVHVAWSLSQVFGIEEQQVHVTSPFVGGGFGAKTMWQHHILAAAASKLAKRPLRLVLSREGVYRLVGGRTTTEQRVAIGAQLDGRFEALIHTGVSAMTKHNSLPEPFTLPARCLYAAGSFKLDVQVADIDMLANTFMRAPGEAVGSFALECAIDELAEQLNIDPVDLRIRNEPAMDPTTGTPFSSRHIVDAYRKGAQRFGWDKRNPKPGAHREGEWLIGVGCATATYPYYRMPGGAARITLTKEGHAIVAISAHEMGMGTATAQTQVIAERLGLSMEQVSFQYGDSSLPGVVLAGGSQQTASIGGAVVAAYRTLVVQLLKLCTKDSPLHGLNPDQVGSRHGSLFPLDKPDRSESYVSILARAGHNEVTVEESAPPPLETMHWSMHSYGALFCEARVNAVTGEPRISRFLGSYDCGRILNSKMAASQFRGGIIMGLGLALLEETQFDERNGRIMNPSLAEYHLPTHLDVPNIDVIWTDIADPYTPMGARGIGEIGITGTGAAVANAIYNACGKRVRELPITLDKLFA